MHEVSTCLDEYADPLTHVLMTRQSLKHEVSTCLDEYVDPWHMSWWLGNPLSTSCQLVND